MNTQSNHIRVHRLVLGTEAEGPGRRAALWVQGCPIRCEGCFNRAAWDVEGGVDRSIEDILSDILGIRNEIEGVSFVGGEPFAQAKALTALGTRCQAEGLSVVTFTGYEVAQLRRACRPDWNSLLAVTDLLLAGPFQNQELDMTRPWVGSRNQEFIFLTDRYAYLRDRLNHVPNRLECVIGAEGGIDLNGLATESDIQRLQLELSELGLQTREVRS